MIDNLIETIAKVTKKNPNEISPEMLLSGIGLSRSLGLTVLRSAVERKFKRKIGLLTWNMTVADIVELLEGRQIQKNPSVEAPLQTIPKITANATTKVHADALNPTRSFGLGVDIEEVENLPLTENFRDHTFYNSNFTSNEIATALLRSAPRVHLCGLFCAKEATKKSDLLLIDLRMNEIEITHDEGRPVIRLIDTALDSAFDFKLSISHTRNFATATVIASRVAE